MNTEIQFRSSHSQVSGLNLYLESGAFFVQKRSLWILQITFFVKFKITLDLKVNKIELRPKPTQGTPGETSSNINFCTYDNPLPTQGSSTPLPGKGMVRVGSLRGKGVGGYLVGMGEGEERPEWVMRIFTDLLRCKCCSKGCGRN